MANLGAGTPMSPVVAREVTAIVVSYNAAEHLPGLPEVPPGQRGRARGRGRQRLRGMSPDQVVRAAGAGWVPTGANLGYGRAANRGAATPEARAATLPAGVQPRYRTGRRSRAAR